MSEENGLFQVNSDLKAVFYMNHILSKSLTLKFVAIKWVYFEVKNTVT